MERGASHRQALAKPGPEDPRAYYRWPTEVAELAPSARETTPVDVLAMPGEIGVAGR